MNYRLRILRLARRDADSQFQWISRRSPSGAERWVQAMERVLAQIARNPQGFGLVRGRSLRRHDVREAPFKTRKGDVYRLLFICIANEVRILRVRSPGQRPVRLSEIEFDDPPELDDLS